MPLENKRNKTNYKIYSIHTGKEYFEKKQPCYWVIIFTLQVFTFSPISLKDNAQRSRVLAGFQLTTFSTIAECCLDILYGLSFLKKNFSAYNMFIRKFSTKLTGFYFYETPRILSQLFYWKFPIQSCFSFIDSVLEPPAFNWH